MYNPGEPQIHPQSVLSFTLGILTVFSLCVGMIPFPFTGFICFPVSFISAILALIFGVISLPKIRNRNKPSILMAWTGIITGGLVLILTLCAIATLIVIFNFAPDYMPDLMPDFWHIQPFNQNYQLYLPQIAALH